jgi:hypothetical protein
VGHYGREKEEQAVSSRWEEEDSKRGGGETKYGIKFFKFSLKKLI